MYGVNGCGDGNGNAGTTVAFALVADNVVLIGISNVRLMLMVVSMEVPIE